MNIPTAVSKREVEVLQRYAKGKYVVEAGSLLGYSTIQLAKTAKHVRSIDRHTGYDHWKNDTLRSFLRNLDVSGCSGLVSSVVGSSILLNDYPCDFAFIDLCGTYGTTLAAIKTARAPIIGVHDFERQSCRGVGEAVKDCGLKVIERVDSLIILGDPNCAY